MLFFFFSFCCCSSSEEKKYTQFFFERNVELIHLFSFSYQNSNQKPRYAAPIVWWSESFYGIRKYKINLRRPSKNIGESLENLQTSQ